MSFCTTWMKSAFSTSNHLRLIQKCTRLRVVDNSKIGKQAMEEGKPPKVIHVYHKRNKAELGDRVLLAVKGEKRKGVLVGAKHRRQEAFRPRFDSNNVVLIDEAGNPLGNRIYVPIPMSLRAKKDQFNKLISIATRFV